MIDGYFVHFTEDEAGLEPLPKYTVFVLDVSIYTTQETCLDLASHVPALGEWLDEWGEDPAAAGLHVRRARLSPQPGLLQYHYLQLWSDGRKPPWLH